MKEHLRDYFPERFENHQAQSKGFMKTMRTALSPDLRDKLNCQLAVRDVFELSDDLRILKGAMNKYGCDFDIDRHISCERCNRCAGGFDPDTKQIVVCTSLGTNHKKIHATIMHEMIHLFDYCRAKFDFDNLDHVACSEIRASNLTYCLPSDRRIGSGWFNFKASHKYCVKDAAFASVQAYVPEKSAKEVGQIIDRVFPFCYNDLEPLGRRATNPVNDRRQAYRERYFYGYI